jgi:hypothetical protein
MMREEKKGWSGKNTENFDKLYTTAPITLQIFVVIVRAYFPLTSKMFAHPPHFLDFGRQCAQGRRSDVLASCSRSRFKLLLSKPPNEKQFEACHLPALNWPV